MSEKKIPEWLENAFVANPEYKFKIEDAGCILVRPTVREKPSPELRWFLDHWLIERKDGDTVLNGTAEEFEKQLGELLDARTTEDS